MANVNLMALLLDLASSLENEILLGIVMVRPMQMVLLMVILIMLVDSILMALQSVQYFGFEHTFLLQQDEAMKCN